MRDASIESNNRKSLAQIFAILGIVFLTIVVCQFVFAQSSHAWAATGGLPDPTAPNCKGPNGISFHCIYRTMIAKTCWLCPAFGAFYEAAVVLGYNVSVIISKSVVQLLGAVLGLWLLWQLVKLFMPFGSMGGVSEIFNKITAKIGLFIFLLVFLSGAGTGFATIWDWIIAPIFTTGISLSTSVLEATQVSTADKNLIAVDLSNPTDCAPGGKDIMSFSTINSGSVNLPADTKNSLTNAGRQLICQIFAVQGMMGVGMGLGVVTVMNAGSDIVAPDISMTEGVNLAPFVSSLARFFIAILMGAALIIVYLIALLLYPLYVVDVIFKFAIIIVISPILAAAYMFEVTRGWTAAGIKGLVGIGATLMFQAVIVGLSLSMVAATIRMGVPGSSTADALAIVFGTLAFGFAGLLFSGGAGTMFFGFVTAGVLVIFLMKKGNQLAQEFVGAGAGHDMLGSMVQGLKTATTAGIAVATGGTSLVKAGANKFDSLFSGGSNLPPASTTPPASFGPTGGGTGLGPAGGGGGGSPFAPTGVLAPSQFTSNIAGPGIPGGGGGMYPAPPLSPTPAPLPPSSSLAGVFGSGPVAPTMSNGPSMTGRSTTGVGIGRGAAQNFMSNSTSSLSGVYDSPTGELYSSSEKVSDPPLTGRSITGAGIGKGAASSLVADSTSSISSANIASTGGAPQQNIIGQMQSAAQKTGAAFDSVTNAVGLGGGGGGITGAYDNMSPEELRAELERQQRFNDELRKNADPKNPPPKK